MASNIVESLSCGKIDISKFVAEKIKECVDDGKKECAVSITGLSMCQRVLAHEMQRHVFQYPNCWSEGVDTVGYKTLYPKRITCNANMSCGGCKVCSVIKE
jgi:hypothetical protein